MSTRITKRQRSAPPRRNATAPYLSELNREASSQGRIPWSLAEQRGRNAHNLSAPRSRGTNENNPVVRYPLAIYRIIGHHHNTKKQVVFEASTTEALVALVALVESQGMEAIISEI